MTARHAVYWAPAADHPLWRAGCDWLGRDPECGWNAPAGPWRAQPRRYGFHATLKPPFALADGVDEPALREALAALAGATASFDMPALSVATLGDFIAVRPREAIAATHPLRRLADACVQELDALRRPARADETARRSAGALSPTQRTHVERWGYPHVFDDWRFHMTLTDGLPADAAGAAARDALLEAARAHFAAALAAPLRCDGLALFVEDAPGADLRLVQRFGLAA